jgi:CheY-like chemotaxis protein
MEAGKLSIKNVNFNIKKFLDETTKAHSVRASEKKLELLYTFSSNLPPYLFGDPNRLQQILNNLINNAIKFTEEGEILVEVRKKEIIGDQIELQFSVKDSGIGISPENMPLLFKSFSQVDSSNTRKFGGTGLGLVISKQLIEMMGGTMWLESEEGKGSTFYFSIPFTIGKKSEETIAVLATNYKSGKNKKILIVEDDKVSQHILTRMLIEKGYQIETADNGMEAIKRYDHNSYDLILMDIQMPVMDGVEATKLIREREEKLNQHTPMIVMTAYALFGDREKFLSLGFDEYIAKPINLEEMLLTIELVMAKFNPSSSQEIEVKVTNQGFLYSYQNQEPSEKLNQEDIIKKLNCKMDELKEIISSNKFQCVEYCANKLKVLLNQIEAEELKNTAFRIELSARRGDYEKVILYSSQIIKDYELLNFVVADYRDCGIEVLCRELHNPVAQQLYRPYHQP